MRGREWPKSRFKDIAQGIPGHLPCAPAPLAPPPGLPGEQGGSVDESSQGWIGLAQGLEKVTVHQIPGEESSYSSTLVLS